jgi:GDP-L-fucose synthase
VTSICYIDAGMAPSELAFRLEGRRIWVACCCGIVGSAVVRRLAREGCELLTVDRDRIDLRRQADVEAWMSETNPEVFILAAARVGGIYANASGPADFLDDNLALRTKVIHSAAEIGVLFLGTTCIYPGLAPQSISESALLTNPLEPTNQWYAIAEIAGSAVPSLSRAARLRFHLRDAERRRMSLSQGPTRKMVTRSD